MRRVPMIRSVLALVALVALPLAPIRLTAQDASTPLRQSQLTFETAQQAPLTIRDAARDDRWFGLGVRDVRWAPDGSEVYFRWNTDPTPADVEEEDPWFAASPDGRTARQLDGTAAQAVPGTEVVRSPDGRTAAWVRDGALYVHDAAEGARRVISLEAAIGSPRFTPDGTAVDFPAGGTLYRYEIAAGALEPLAVRTTRQIETHTDAATWLRAQQSELFDHVREQARRTERSEAAVRAGRDGPQAIPLPSGVVVDQMQASPDGRWITFRARTPSAERPGTAYVDYVDASGYSQVGEARSKVGEPRDVYRLGVVAVDPSVPEDSVTLRWIDVSEAGDEGTVSHGPWWSPDGRTALVQFLGENHKDVWFAEVDLAEATASVLLHDHDDAWLGGPPIQAGRLQPGLVRWLPDGSFVFASERSGWSHLYRRDTNGAVRPLTEGAWEVRQARLSPDRSSWLLQAGREDASEDHLYVMPAAGGDLVRLTDAPGRHEGWWSPDGEQLAVLSSDATHLPDLHLTRPRQGAESRRATVSGTDDFYRHPLAEPEIVRITHPDGDPVWAALYRPETPNAERSAIVHIHGGGYRQFAHRGYSVYGYALHLGFIHYMLEQGYTVLDFDYRLSAGFGRDYRTDVANSMGISDTDGAVAAARWLADNAGVDPARIGIYGVSYGGFLTLTSLFRYPGVFAAGIARAAVTDWAHYSDSWTSRILGVPHENPEAYRRSSPIYYAEGLEDPLLITHGLVDDNVHFQDAARLIQRLIELEKDFDVMVYPVEPHTVETEASRYDLLRRQARFFDRHLRGIER